MAVSLTHAKVSGVSDSGNASLVQPSDWNDEHELTATDGKLLGASGSTTVGEITVGTGLSLAAGTLTASASAGGSDTQVQFNDGGTTFGGDAGLVYNKTTDALTVNGALLKGTNDNGALGASGTAWSDLFLASGGVINFNAGDVTLTHSADTLTIGGNGTTAITLSGTLSGAGTYTIFAGNDQFGAGMAILGDGTGGNPRQQLTAYGVNATGYFGLASSLSTSAYTFPDLYLRRSAAANLALGAADAASPVAQTISVQNVVAGTSDTAGVDFSIKASASTGSGQPGAIVFYASPRGPVASGSTVNTQVAVAKVYTTDYWHGLYFANSSGSFANPAGIGGTSNALIFGSQYGTSGYLNFSDSGGGAGSVATFKLPASGLYGIASAAGADNDGDVWLGRQGAANWRFGPAAAASPVAQTLSVQNVVAGTSDTAGAAFTISGSQGTGTGAGGSIILQTAKASTTGNTQNALTTALTVNTTTVAVAAEYKLATTISASKTIASGVITVTGSYHRIETEGAGATDDLDTINGGVDGMRLVIRPLDAAHTVVVKDGTGNIQCVGDFTMDNAQDTMELIFDSALSAWLELGRSDNGA